MEKRQGGKLRAAGKRLECRQEALHYCDQPDDVFPAQGSFNEERTPSSKALTQLTHE